MTAAVASLPMYDLPELGWATDALWTSIAGSLTRRGVADVPPTLERQRPFTAAWTDPDLLLGQTCGYCVTHDLRGRVRLIATLRYSAPGCTGPAYSSFLVVGRGSDALRLEDLRGGVAAVNHVDSHSGMNALRHAVAPLARDGRFFGRVEVTGAHRTNLERIAAGAVDVAAIDCVTLALVARVQPELVAAVRVIGQSPAVPGVPLITRGAASDREVAVLRAAVEDGVATLGPAAASALLLAGVDVVPLAAYAAIDALEADAVERGYPALA